MNDLLMAGAILTFMGLGFLYFCSRYLLSEWKSKREGVVVVAQVVGEEVRTKTVSTSRAGSSINSRETRTYSFPVVEFQLADGRLWRGSTKVNAPAPMPRGATVQVRYLPSDPNDIWLAGNSNSWIVYILLAVGIGLLLGGLVMLGFATDVL